MGYDSRLLGDLQVGFKGEVEPDYPEEILEVVKKYNVDLPEKVIRVGFSPEAIEKLHAVEEFDFWFSVTEESLSATGDGRDRNLHNVIGSLMKIAKEDNCSITGTLYLEGSESVGELTRYIFTGDDYNKEEAKLVFSDGTVYNG
jgi:hypothetical protein